MVDISVCIPAFNCEKTIQRAVDSILRQDVNVEIEIIICDDGSTDATPQIIEKIASDHHQVRIVRNMGNRGRPYTRNVLLREARGQYLTWLDADDEKYPSMLRLQHEKLEKIRREEGIAGVDGTLVFCNFHWLWPNMKAPKLVAPPEAELHMEHLLSSEFGGYLWLMMGTAETFRKVGDFDLDLPRLQDLDFFIKFAKLGGRFCRADTDQPLCIYYKDDHARDAMSVWRSWNRIWVKHRLLYLSYGFANAMKWRRHHCRVSRRFAKANSDWKTYYWIALYEVFLLAFVRLRKAIA